MAEIFGGTVQMQKKYRPKWPYIVGVIVLLIGYGIGSAIWGYRYYKPKANEYATALHQDFNSGEYSKIYAAADEELKSKNKEDEFDQFMGAVHTKLGNVQDSSQEFLQVNKSTSGTFVHATFTTRFEHGSGIEHISWRVSNDQAFLLNYTIDSKELVIR
jgi:hypothetical protein